MPADTARDRLLARYRDEHTGPVVAGGVPACVLPPLPSVTAPIPTVRDRLRSAGISEDRIIEHAAAGRVRLDGEPAGLDAPAPAGTRVTLWPA